MSNKIPKKKRVTMKDVARAVGVSQMTVSNVINKRPASVSAKLEKKIEREIRRLNYRVLKQGRNLRLAEHGAVGILIIDESKSYLRDAFNNKVVSGLSNRLSDFGYSTVLQGCRLIDIESAVMMRDLGADGLCVIAGGTEPERQGAIDRLLDLGEPLVLVEETLSQSESDDVCIVRQDDFGGGRLIADHLIARGARKFAVLTPKLEWAAQIARIRGVEDALNNAAIEFELDVITAPEEEALSAQDAMAEYLDANELPDAIIGGNDMLAIAVMQLLEKRKIKIPKQVMLTGFNAFDLYECTSPTLTTVRSNAYEIGLEAADLMIARLKEGNFKKPVSSLPVYFCPGEST